MSTTAQLERWAAENAPLYNDATFLGVFASDQLPDPHTVAIRAPAALVVNYDPGDMPGSHWCSILVTRRAVLWFDSHGLLPDAPDLLVGHSTSFGCWLSSLCLHLGLRRYSWNTADLQSLAETTCGHWAVLLLQDGPKKGWRRFGPDQEANDALIRQLVLFT